MLKTLNQKHILFGITMLALLVSPLGYIQFLFKLVRPNPFLVLLFCFIFSFAIINSLLWLFPNLFFTVSRSKQTKRTIMICYNLLAVTYFPLLVFFLNQFIPIGSGTTVLTTITHKNSGRSSRRSSSISYTVKVEALGGIRAITIDQSVWETLQVGDTGRIHFRNGIFGFTTFHHAEFPKS